jgi:hypothetical protein
MSIGATTASRRWLIASLLFISVAAALGVRPAGGAHAAVSGQDAISAPVTVRSSATIPIEPDAEPGLERMIALHRSVMLAPLRAKAAGFCCGSVAAH